MADKVFVSLNQELEPVDLGKKLTAENNFGTDRLVLRLKPSSSDQTSPQSKTQAQLLNERPKFNEVMEECMINRGKKLDQQNNC